MDPRTMVAPRGLLKPKYATAPLHRAQIGDDCVEVTWGQDLIEIRRHDRGKMNTVRSFAFAQRGLDLVFGPRADASVLVLRDVGGRNLERRLIPAQSAGEIALENWRAARPSGCGSFDRSYGGDEIHHA